MKKKLQSFLKTPFILLGFIFLSSCTKEYYTVDNGDNWKILEYTVDTNNSTNYPKWEWDPVNRRYFSIVDMSGSNVSIDEFIYNKGMTLGFVFTGTENVDEFQNPLPYEQREIGAKLWYDTSILGKDRLFETCFYFQWDDLRGELPPRYNFRLVLHW